MARQTPRKAKQKRARSARPAVLLGLLLVLVVIWFAASPVIAEESAAFLVLLLSIRPALGLRERRLKARALRAVTVAQLDDMSGQQFERYVAALLESEGYSTSLTPNSNDYGADIIAERKKQKLAVQTKRYRETVGGQAISQVVAAEKYYGCNQTMVVTTGSFTPAARTLAASNGCVLVDRQELGKWVARFQRSERSRGRLARQEAAALQEPVVVARLECIDGPQAGNVFPLPSLATVGRDASSALALTGDALVSPHHAMLTESPVGWVVTDLESESGTFVNDERVASRVLQPGDTLRFGQSKYRICWPGP